jgi:hypothetical protein
MSNYYRVKVRIIGYAGTGVIAFIPLGTEEVLRGKALGTLNGVVNRPGIRGGSNS